MKTINSIHNAIIKDFEKLHDKKYRTINKLFILEGYHLIEEAFQSNCLKVILSTDLEVLKNYQSINSFLVSKQIISKLSTTQNPQNVLGIGRMLKHDFSQIWDLLNNEIVKLAVFDQISDPGNMGTMIRTVAALGYDAIILSSNCVDIYNQKVLRSSQGSIFKIPIIIGDLIEIIPILKEKQIYCYGTSLENAVNINNIKSYNKFAICFGNESQGVRKDILKLMNQNIKINMKNNVESLNVMVASSIIMYELMRFENNDE